ILPNAPGNVGDGGALTSDGTFIYAFQGKTRTFWRFDPVANTWTTLAPWQFTSSPATGNVTKGGSLVAVPANNPQGRFTSLAPSRSLVVTGDPVTVTVQLSSSTAVTGVTAGSLVTTPTGGASCSTLTGPTLTSADNNITDINDPVTYR